MTQLEIPGAELTAVTLEPERRVVLGKEPDVSALQDRLALGRPVVVPLDPTTVDDDARHFLAGRPQSRFYLLALTTSFTGDDDSPFVSAWVDITLQTTMPAGADDPVAWSMRPLSLSDNIAVSRTVTLDASLKFTAPVGIEAGPSVTMERAASHERKLAWLQALNEGTNRPRWVLSATKITAISGVHRLFLIIDLPVDAHGAAEVGVGATVRLRRWKVFRYCAAIPDAPGIARVELPPE